MITTAPVTLSVESSSAWLATQRNLSADTFLGAVEQLGRKHGPYLLCQSVMDEAFGSTEGFTWHSPALLEQAKATASVWSACEKPAQLLNPAEWTVLFAMIGYTVDGAFADHPSEPIRLYRGATLESRLGMAWTSDFDTAVRFAGHEKVWTAVFEPTHLLARIIWRGEDTYVVDPAAFDPEGYDLTDVEEFVTVSAAAAAASTGTGLVPHLFEVEEMASWVVTERGFTAAAFAQVEKRVGHDGAAHVLLRAAQAGVFAPSELAAALTNVWADDGRVSKMHRLDEWTELFTMAGYMIDGILADRPTEPVRLYRGAPQEGRLGMSWTSDLDTARFFTIPVHGDYGKIWTAVFDPTHLLARITWRGEAEFVVDPTALASGLVDVQELA